ncbi:hypothetical protein FRACA_120025 [Frankia canadensis]|uniref:Uncharacterized protein n=1 Tax=Frankia canadensis TaxID=1836972 RepID=A0A2I2KJW3_9ACTN|nr:hypothetical protein FRACA_120025 [Frankia canadensis]SOU53252.1 hypothetical protein FRACA_120025 [Frankia canadensis]
MKVLRSAAIGRRRLGRRGPTHGDLQASPALTEANTDADDSRQGPGQAASVCAMRPLAGHSSPLLASGRCPVVRPHTGASPTR